MLRLGQGWLHFPAQIEPADSLGLVPVPPHAQIHAFFPSPVGIRQINPEVGGHMVDMQFPAVAVDSVFGAVRAHELYGRTSSSTCDAAAVGV